MTDDPTRDIQYVQFRERQTRDELIEVTLARYAARECGKWAEPTNVAIQAAADAYRAAHASPAPPSFGGVFLGRPFEEWVRIQNWLYQRSADSSGTLVAMAERVLARTAPPPVLTEARVREIARELDNRCNLFLDPAEWEEIDQRIGRAIGKAIRNAPRPPDTVAEPIAHCSKCGRAWYTLEGYCGGCRP